MNETSRPYRDEIKKALKHSRLVTSSSSTGCQLFPLDVESFYSRAQLINVSIRFFIDGNRRIKIFAEQWNRPVDNNESSKLHE